MSQLLAYHNDPLIKEKLLSKLQAHYDADEIIKGIYWENGKGCAVGCAIESNDHRLYESMYGIPIILGKLQDRLFENLPNIESKNWALDFHKVIPVGKDLSKVWFKFAIWLLDDEQYGVKNFAKTENTKTSIERVHALYTKLLFNEKVDIIEIRYIRSAAADAAAAAAYAAYAAAAAYAADTAAAYAADAAAADAAADAAAADADADAADAAAYAAAADAAAADADAYAAAAADAAADAAAADAAADAYAAAADAAAAVRENHYIAQSKKLIELLEE